MASTMTETTAPTSPHYTRQSSHVASPCNCLRHYRQSDLTTPAPSCLNLMDHDSISPWNYVMESSQRASRPSSAHSTQSYTSLLECRCSDSCPMACPSHDVPHSAVSSPVMPTQQQPFQRPFEGKSVVFLRTSSTARAPVYAKLREQGLRIVMVHPKACPELFPAVHDWIERDTTDVNSLFNLLTSDEWIGCFDAVASFDEYGVFPAATLNRRLGKRPLPLTPAMLSTINIKSRFREWNTKHGLSAPRYAAVHRAEQCPVEIVRNASLLYPLVVKPAPGAGSNLVTLIDREEDLVPCVNRLWAAIAAMRPTAAHFEALGEPIHVLIEEFIEGPEVDVDAIVENGVVKFAGVSDNFPTVRPYFSEVGGLAPSALAACHQDNLVALLEAFVDATTKEGESLTGILHFEAKVDSRRDVPVIIEVNCRMGSAETHTMITNAFGVDLAEAALRLALDMPLQPLPKHTPGRAAAGCGVVCASANLYPTKAGALVALRPPTPQPPLLRAMTFPLSAGDAVKLPPDSFGCLIWLVAAGPDAKTAIQNMKELSAQCSIDVATA
jgi:biotin carboxylase